MGHHCDFTVSFLYLTFCIKPSATKREKESCWYSSYILRRPQNFAKFPSCFCPMQCQSKVRWRCRKNFVAFSKCMNFKDLQKLGLKLDCMYYWQIEWLKQHYYKQNHSNLLILAYMPTFLLKQIKKFNCGVNFSFCSQKISFNHYFFLMKLCFL